MAYIEEGGYIIGGPRRPFLLDKQDDMSLLVREAVFSGTSRYLS